ncbi:MAG TPA: hypothetical protein VLF41_00695 [Candidatus Nanoarchaeia archaeon]|nr:hypothetical protein [Candidatus Nanoarchaeia archaeon]
MYSGFVSHKRVLKSIGIHQRFDMSAYRAIKPFIEAGDFPPMSQILEFEGLGGPDGLKVKSPGEHEPSHLYDPASDTGEVPVHIENHYRQMVEALSRKDMIRAAFEAGWLAHYITDGLTPAHHFPLEDKMAELDLDFADINAKSGKQRMERARTLPISSSIRKNWVLWGRKGLLSTHVNFEIGVATALLVFPIRIQLDDRQLADARRRGAVEFFKEEARQIAKLKIYDKFYADGWTAEIANMIRREVAPRTAKVVACIWLLAYLDAQQLNLTGRKFKPDRFFDKASTGHN